MKKTPGDESIIPDKEIRRNFDSIMEVKNMFATRTLEHDKIILEKGMEQSAINMIKEGLEDSIITNCTGISKQKLFELRKDCNKR